MFCLSVTQSEYAGRPQDSPSCSSIRPAGSPPSVFCNASFAVDQRKKDIFLIEMFQYRTFRSGQQVSNFTQLRPFVSVSTENLLGSLQQDYQVSRSGAHFC